MEFLHGTSVRRLFQSLLCFGFMSYGAIFMSSNSNAADRRDSGAGSWSNTASYLARSQILTFTCLPPRLYVDPDTGRRNLWWRNEDTCQELPESVENERATRPSYVRYRANAVLLSTQGYALTWNGKVLPYCRSEFQVQDGSDYTVDYRDYRYELVTRQTPWTSGQGCFQQTMYASGSLTYGVPTILPKGTDSRIVIDHPCESITPTKGLPWSAHYQLKLRAGKAFTNLYIDAEPASSSDRRTLWNVEWPDHPFKTRGEGWSASGFQCSFTQE